MNILGKASDLASTAQGHATSLAAKGQGLADKHAPGATALAGQAGGLAAQHAGAVAGVAAQHGGALMNAAQNKAEEAKQQIKDAVEVFIKTKMLLVANKIVDMLPGMLKDGLEDADMPRCVSRGKDKAIDALWPDVHDEIMNEVVVMLDGTPAEEAYQDREGPGNMCCRAFWRYHLFPCDRSVWGQIRDPFFVMWKLVSLIPLQGVTPFMFLLLFIIIDKGDEFQLVFFVLYFKGTMFISQGVIRSIVGFFQFLSCATMPAIANPNDPHPENNCDSAGPGVIGNMLLPLVGFVLQSVLVWMAFCMLPYSEDKGAAKLGKLEGAQEVKGTKVKGGYLQYFLFYDLFCALICLAAIGAVLASRDSDEMLTWPVAHMLFAIQVVYGYLSMPFFIFTLPFVQNVLTHSIPTAYDSKGVCRKFRKAVGVSARAKRLEAESAALAERPSIGDKVAMRREAMKELLNSDELQAKIKTITSKITGGFGGGSAASSAVP